MLVARALAGLARRGAQRVIGKGGKGGGGGSQNLLLGSGVGNHGAAARARGGAKGKDVGSLLHHESSSSLATQTNGGEELSFSLSGAGFLSPFHIGVMEALLEKGVITDKTKLAGASGGALVAGSTAVGIEPSKQMEAYRKMSKICHASGFIGRVRGVLGESLHESFPHDAHRIANERLTIAVMQIWPRPQLAPELLTKFHSRDDLIDALMTSSHVPFYFDYTAPLTYFRGGLYADGGLIDLVPPIPGSIKVCVFPGHVLYRNDLHITPALLSDFPFSLPQLIRYAFIAPESTKEADLLLKLGYRAAMEWIKEGGRDKAAEVAEMASTSSSLLTNEAAVDSSSINRISSSSPEGGGGGGGGGRTGTEKWRGG